LPLQSTDLFILGKIVKHFPKIFVNVQGGDASQLR